MDRKDDLVLGTITWRRSGRRWRATFHSDDGFFSIESDREQEALDYAIVTSFLLAPAAEPSS